MVKHVHPAHDYIEKTMEKQRSEIKKRFVWIAPLKCCYVVSSVFYAMLWGGGVLWIKPNI